MKKRKFLINAAVLTAASLFIRTLMIGFRVYLSREIGTAGMGLYQLIFSVFIFTITFSVSGISLSVTRLTAETIACNKPEYVKSYLKKCIAFCLTLSLLAMSALFFSANFIAVNLLNDSRAALPLQILAFGLPFMAVSVCLKGYFIAIRNTIKPASSEVLEQIVTIGIVVVLFTYFSKDDLQSKSCAIMLGCTLGEVFSFFYTYLLYRFSIHQIYKKYQIKHSLKSHGVLKKITHITLPVMLSSSLRSLLSTVEHILIPKGFKKYGASTEASLSQYGVIHGMAMPVLYFPSAFLMALSSLLVPEMAEANAAGKQRTIERTTSRSMQVTLVFSIFVTAFFIAFSEDLGMALYQNKQCCVLLKILAPLVPLMYLDSVVDGILKGLDQQLSSMKYNFSDSALRVVLIYFLIPFAGVKGYICVLFFSTIFNASLSIHRLIKVSKVQVQFLNWVFKPALCSALSVLFIRLLFFLPFFNRLPDWQCVAIEVVLSGGMYYFFLRICSSLTREDVAWIKSIFTQ